MVAVSLRSSGTSRTALGNSPSKVGIAIHLDGLVTQVPAPGCISPSVSSFTSSGTVETVSWGTTISNP